MKSAFVVSAFALTFCGVLCQSCSNPNHNDFPNIDGVIDPVWSKASYIPLRTEVRNEVGNYPDSDFSAKAKALWSPDTFFVLVEVFDDTLRNDHAVDHQNDLVEVFFDLDNAKNNLDYTLTGPGVPSSYDGKNDYMLRFVWEADNYKILYGRNGQLEERMAEEGFGVSFAQAQTPTGWLLEASFPWASISEGAFKPEVGQEIGFDLMVTDNDNGQRQIQRSVHIPVDEAYRDIGLLGTIRLKPEGQVEVITSPSK